MALVKIFRGMGLAHSTGQFSFSFNCQIKILKQHISFNPTSSLCHEVWAINHPFG
jgi:hypothetical protein